ncbi:MAG: tetratricopeptide repeat protein [Bacteroidota bacterium]
MTERLQQLFAFLEKAPQDSFTRYSIAYEYLAQGDLSKALEHFNLLKSHDPQYLGLYYHLGKVHERLEDYTQAIHVYDEGLEIARQQKDAHAEGELLRARQQAQDELEEW